MGDWGPQQTALAHIMPSLPGLDVPVWNHAVVTGDAPLELYPAFAYLVTGHLAILFGLRGDLPLAFMIVAVIVHVSIAAMTTAIATRVAAKPVALAIGVIMLIDGGAISHGGTVGLFHWGLFHSAMALAFALVAVLGVMSALRRPRIGAAVAIWVGVALATATHPAALIGSAACLVGLCAAALLANDVQPRRALAAAGHVVIGVALGAVVWMPMAARILAYGQHYPNVPRSAAKLLNDILIYPSPVTFYALFAYAGYLGIVVGLWSRRARVIFISATALVLIVGLCDLPYLALGLAPGQGVARLGVERLGQIARPFVFVAGAYGIAVLLGHARAAWTGATPRARLVAAAMMGVLGALLLRQLPPLWRSASSRAIEEAQQFAPDPEGRAQLTSWAQQRAAELRPDAYARAIFEEDTHEHMRLTADTGLPTFHLIWLPDMLLRERIEDGSSASLARFNVRWDVALDHAPQLGDPDTEVVFGRYHIRELRSWDGKFARVERGQGDVRVTRLDDRQVDVEVTAAAPVLVALGTGFYPRWRATHASGEDEPVYAYPTIKGGKLHVVSAWLAPGHTTFTVDGPLPSDHDGRALSLLAALFALASAMLWSRTRWRVAALRRMVVARRAVLRWLRAGTSVVVAVVLVVLLIRGITGESQPARALLVGSGIRGSATVEAREPGGEWRTCDYHRWSGEYRCDELVTVSDGLAGLLNDVTPSWPFTTPAIVAAPDPGVGRLTLRVTRTLSLEGHYLYAATDGAGTLTIAGKALAISSRREASTQIDGNVSREVVLQVDVVQARPDVPWSFTFVREDTLQPPHDYLVPPPETAPIAIQGIR